MELQAIRELDVELHEDGFAVIDLVVGMGRHWATCPALFFGYWI